MAIATDGYVEISADRFLKPIRVNRESDGKLRIEIPYTVRVGAVDENHILYGSASADDETMQDLWNSVYYQVNEGADGEVTPDIYPYGGEPPP